MTTEVVKKTTYRLELPSCLHRKTPSTPFTSRSLLGPYVASKERRFPGRVGEEEDENERDESCQLPRQRDLDVDPVRGKRDHSLAIPNRAEGDTSLLPTGHGRECRQSPSGQLSRGRDGQDNERDSQSVFACQLQNGDGGGSAHGVKTN
jgi:hypothetical protein